AEALPLGEWPADGHVVAVSLEDRGNRLDSTRQVILPIALTAPMVLGADRRLVHAGYQRGPAGRADRGCDERATKHRSLPRQPVDVRRLDSRLSITREVRGHVIDNEPNDVGSLPIALCGGGGPECDRWEHHKNADERQPQRCGQKSTDWFHGGH